MLRRWILLPLLVVCVAGPAAGEVSCGCADRWVPWLSDSQPEVRDVARRIILELGEEACSAIPSLVAELDARADALERTDILVALRAATPEVGLTPDVVTRLVDIVEPDRLDPEPVELGGDVLRLAAMLTLAREPSAIELLRPLFRSSDSELRSFALAEVLAALPADREARRGARDEVERNPDGALTIAWRLRGDELLHFARQMLESPNAEARAGILDALGEFAKPHAPDRPALLEVSRVEPLLRGGRGDPSPSVREAALRALQHLGLDGPEVPESTWVVACNLRGDGTGLGFAAQHPEAWRLVISAASDRCARTRLAAARLLYRADDGPRAELVRRSDGWRRTPSPRRATWLAGR